MLLLQDRDSQKTHWVDRCVEEVKNDKWVLPALKQIREICNLYSEAPPNFNHAQRSPHMFYRHEVINRLQTHHSLVILVADNLTTYMKRAHVMAKGKYDFFMGCCMLSLYLVHAGKNPCKDILLIEKS